jgi:multidrug resistance efflux pump
MRAVRTFAVLVVLGAVGLALGRAAVPVLPAAPADPPAKADDDPSRPSNCLVTVKSIDVPSQEAGQIKEFKVEEGQEVSERTLLAMIDESQAKMAQKVAKSKLAAAEEDAGNDVSVRYARKGLQIADVDYQQDLEVEKTKTGAITDYQIRHDFFKVEEAKLGIEEAEHKRGVAVLMADVRRAELEAADLDVRRREIRSPCNGRVEKRYREVGEWLRPGDPVLQILKTDVVYVQGYMDASRLTPADVEGRPVTVTVPVPRGEVVFDGTVVFASFKIDSRRRSLVKAEVKNRKNNDHWILRDGMDAAMVIDLKR